MAMPILVCLGTTAVLELRRMAMRGDEGKALDELRASEQKLTKLVQVGGARCREKEESSLREPPQGESGGFVAARGGGKRREFAILAEELFPDQIWSLSGSEIQTAAKEKEDWTPRFFSRHAPRCVRFLVRRGEMIYELVSTGRIERKETRTESEREKEKRKQRETRIRPSSSTRAPSARPFATSDDDGDDGALFLLLTLSLSHLTLHHPPPTHPPTPHLSKQAMEKELAKEKAATATASDRAASLAATSEALRKVQHELRERARAAEAEASQEKRRAEAAERLAEQARKDALAAADKLEAALEGLKKDVAKALAKFAKGGFGAAIGAKRGMIGWLPGRKASNAEAFLEHMKKLGVEVEATPAELDALASAAAAAEAEAKAAAAAASGSESKNKSLPSSSSSSSSVPRLELSVDAATWARQLRLVCDDPVRIARALAVNGAASPAIGSGGARSAASATSLNPAVAAAAAATASVPLPFQRAVRSPPKPKQRSLPSSPVKKENAGNAGNEQQQQQAQQRQRAPASPPKPPQIEPESPRPAAGRRFVLRTNVNEANTKKASNAVAGKAIGASSGKAGGRVGMNLSLKLEEEAAGLLSSAGAGGVGGDFDGLSRSIVPR